MVAATVDSIDIAAIFGTFLTDVGHRFLEETGRFFMFPIAAMASAIRAVLAWRQVKIDKGENGTIGRAVVETVGALAVVTAVVGGLAAASFAAVASPIIFVAALAAKTLFHLASSIYYFAKSFKSSNTQQETQHYRAMALSNVIGTVALALATVAVGFVMIMAKPALAILGVIAGTIGTAFGLYKLCTTPTPPANGYTTLASDEPVTSPGVGDGPSQAVKLHQRLSVVMPTPATDVNSSVVPVVSVAAESGFNPDLSVGLLSGNGMFSASDRNAGVNVDERQLGKSLSR